jgi:hypothetical protein
MTSAIVSSKEEEDRILRDLIRATPSTIDMNDPTIVAIDLNLNTYTAKQAVDKYDNDHSDNIL